MDKEKETKVEAEQVETEKVETKKAEPKKKKAEEPKLEVAKPKKVNKKAFVERKLKAINSMSNAFLSERQAERLMSRR